MRNVKCLIHNEPKAVTKVFAKLRSNKKKKTLRLLTTLRLLLRTMHTFLLYRFHSFLQWKRKTALTPNRGQRDALLVRHLFTFTPRSSWTKYGAVFNCSAVHSTDRHTHQTFHYSHRHYRIECSNGNHKYKIYTLVFVSWLHIKLQTHKGNGALPRMETTGYMDLTRSNNLRLKYMWIWVYSSCQ